MKPSLDPSLVVLLQLAYSAERAAAFAYQGHARSVTDPEERAFIARVEADEWRHRESVGRLLATLGLRPSRWYEVRYWILGRLISAACHVGGWFLPMFFAGCLEARNVHEYDTMLAGFHAAGVHEHDAILSEMAGTERDHEAYFLGRVQGHWLLPLFRRVFRWGHDIRRAEVGQEAR